ncbi:hypothetical protein HHK36_030229 [Tetracentron sinense]|uniref:Plant heme peroxidase family profile domain-containing protein n=1 Tax=Tetracentron sinense TaxID=13715 RepID=A0A835D0G4_TETSI|nr:hypothetical protein HHK36_030229 [Tetracentron sinense]
MGLVAVCSRSTSRSSYACIMVTMMLLHAYMPCEAHLSSTFYDKMCPNALNTIRTSIRTAVSSERRMAASLIRLHFHDCFVQGCDASILLDEAASATSERNALQNLRSARGYEVIEVAKSQVESICPGVVSCADILAVAARDASVAGLSARDMVALSGSHTIGQAQCVTFRDRIYNNASDIDAGFASTRKRRCPTNDGNVIWRLSIWCTKFFRQQLLQESNSKKGLLESDQGYKEVCSSITRFGSKVGRPFEN